MNLKGRHFLTLKDYSPEEIEYLLNLAAELKAKKKAGELHEYYKVLRILQEFLAECLTVSNIVDTDSARWKSWRSLPEFLYGMV